MLGLQICKHSVVDNEYHRYLESLDRLLPYGKLVRHACNYLTSGNPAYLTTDVAEFIALLIEDARNEGLERAELASDFDLILGDTIGVEYKGKVIGRIDANGYTQED